MFLYERDGIIKIFYQIPQYLIASPVSFVFDEVSFCLVLCIINACLARPCPFSQQNCNEHVPLLPAVSSAPTWGNRGDKKNSCRQIIPAFVTALSYYPTRRARRLQEVDPRTVGVPLSHLSSLKAAHHWGNGKINIDSAANLCIHHCCYMGSFVCRRSSMPDEATRRAD